MPRVWDVPVHDSTRVRDARVAAEHAAAVAGLDEQRTSAAALVATELATNLLKHAGGGRVVVDVVAPPVLAADREPRPRVQIATVDHGPGMADVSAALRDGFTTTTGSSVRASALARASPTTSTCTVHPAGARWWSPGSACPRPAPPIPVRRLGCGPAR